MDIIEQMERDAQLASEENAGHGLQDLGMKALQLEQEISDYEGRAKARKKELERLMRYSIPSALAEAGIPEFGFDHDGGTARITSETKVVGSLRNAPDEQEAIDYLENNGLRGVARSTVALDFSQDEMEEAENLVVAIEGITGKYPTLSRTIHPQTLMAFVREKLKEDPTFDYEKVGVTAFPQAKFTKRK